MEIDSLNLAMMAVRALSIPPNKLVLIRFCLLIFTPLSLHSFDDEFEQKSIQHLGFSNGQKNQTCPILLNSIFLFYLWISSIVFLVLFPFLCYFCYSLPSTDIGFGSVA